MPTAFRPVLWTDKLVKEVLGSDLRQIPGSDEPWQAIGVSRRPDIIEPGELYIAVGKREDRLHARVPEMFRRGAVAAIVAAPIPSVQSWSPVYRVSQSLTAGEYARQRAQAKVIGVTGSVGKTSVKDVLLHILSHCETAFANYQNANDSWGIPESLSNLPPGVRYAAFELGMGAPGSIAPKSEQVRPHVALITAIASAHLGHHGSMASIAETKADIVGEEEEEASRLREQYPARRTARPLRTSHGLCRGYPRWTWPAARAGHTLSIPTRLRMADRPRGRVRLREFIPPRQCSRRDVRALALALDRRRPLE